MSGPLRGRSAPTRDPTVEVDPSYESPHQGEHVEPSNTSDGALTKMFILTLILCLGQKFRLIREFRAQEKFFSKRDQTRTYFGSSKVRLAVSYARFDPGKAKVNAPYLVELLGLFDYSGLIGIRKPGRK